MEGKTPWVEPQALHRVLTLFALLLCLSFFFYCFVKQAASNGRCGGPQGELVEKSLLKWTMPMLGEQQGLP